MRTACLLVVVGSFLGWSGCRTLEEPREVPARISDPTPESRAELRRVVSEALRRSEVIIADDALTSSSLLIIERRRPRDLHGRQMTGREVDRPEQFRLLRIGSRCVLVRQPDGPRWELTHTTCVPE